MSVILYKDGEPYKIEPQYLQAHLDMGFSLTKTPEKQETEEEPNEEEFRAIAKELGIKNWHNKKLDNLLPEIEATQNVGTED